MLMTVSTRVVIVLSALAAASSAQAQTYGQPPLYPYELQQPYAVEVAPNTYVIHRPAAHHTTQKFERPHKPIDHGLVEELRKSTPPKDVNEPVITTRKVVHEKPVVHETTRVVDDPPRVIVHRHVVEDLPPSPPHRQAEAPVDVVGDTGKVAASDGKPPRVIRAEAEVTIIGPDRMSIRLFRKRGEPQAKAQPDE
jgi:hypothetical protein